MNPTPLIALDRITKTYVNGELSVEVLHGISLSISHGEFVAIMGASGSGKTTLMNILGCLDRPTGGSYRFEGEDVAALSPDGLARLRRDAFGFIFQSYNLIPTATALENVQVPAIYAGMPAAARHERAEEILETLGLGERLEHLPSQLSGGQQQRVSIARALMNGGRVILADEPTGALDSHTGAEVMRLLRELRDRGHTVILITHAREVAECADRVIEIKDGLIVADSARTAVVAQASPGHDGIAGATRATEALMPVLLGEVSEAIRIATRALRANVFRTFLTLLGIVIGVGSVIAMLAVGDGAKQAVLERISKMGSDLLLVRPGARNLRGTTGVVATLEPEDAQVIAAVPNVANVVPERNGTSVLRFGNADYQTQISATTEGLPTVRDWPVARGTFFNAADVQSYGPVIVLGQTAAANLFPEEVDPVGQYVLVNNVPFQVLGVMTAKGATAWGSDMDDIAFVPLTTGRLRLFGNRYLSAILVQVEDVSRIGATEEAINAVFRQQFRTRDFRIRNMAAILDTAEQAQGTLTILLGAIAAISLLVGGIGVMNIMLVSVTERTREIGIRVATGARTANILQQFLTESVVVSAIGGAIGVVGGLGVAWALANLGTPVQFSTMPVVLAFGCAFATGVVFGYLPARKAATVDPVVALSAE